MKPNLIQASICTCLIMLGLSMHGQTTSKGPQPIITNGEAQIVPEYRDRLVQELWVETTFDSDGDGRLDRMHTYVTRPTVTDSFDLKLPVIYTTSPYYGLRLWALLDLFRGNTYWNVKHELGEQPKPHHHSNLGTRTKRPFMAFYMDNLWTTRGFIMVYSSSPGTGLSDGSPTVGGENESLAPKAVIDWLCGRGKAYSTRTGNDEVKAFWCNGKVGMTGTSYDGTLCIAAATTGVQGLEAIIPVAPVTSFYNYYRSNGLVRSPDGYLGEDMDVLYDFINSGDKSKRARNDREVRDSILVKNIDRVTGDYNAFWASRDYLNDIDNMHCAMLMAHGFNDWNVMTEQSYRFYLAAKEKGLPVQLYYHQQDHGGDPPLTMMNRWFTHYLFGENNGVENDPPVQIVREFEELPTPYAAFPDPDAENVTLYLQGGVNNTGSLIIAANNTLVLDTLVDDYTISGDMLIQEKYSEHRLLFVTPTLKKDIRISGIPNVSIRMASSASAANLSVWLVALPWEDEKNTQLYENIINRSWADPQNYRSISKGELLKIGEFYQVNFNLMPDDQVIPQGQQIGLMIFSSDKDFTIAPKPGTELTIDLSRTNITIPFVGGVEAYEDAVK